MAILRRGPPPPPPRGPAPVPPAVQRRDVARLLARLEDTLIQARELDEAARQDVEVGGLARFRLFSRKVRDFFAMAGVAEERMEAMPELYDASWRTALDRLHARTVLLFVEGSASFFNAYSRVEHLPIGTHEICTVELRGIVAISGFFNDPRYDGDQGHLLRARVDRVIGQVRTLIERMPPLPVFDDEPSLDPRGKTSHPIPGAARRAEAERAELERARARGTPVPGSGPGLARAPAPPPRVAQAQVSQAGGPAAPAPRTSPPEPPQPPPPAPAPQRVLAPGMPQRGAPATVWRPATAPAPPPAPAPETPGVRQLTFDDVNDADG
jgi:hypothetical protein